MHENATQTGTASNPRINVKRIVASVIIVCIIALCYLWSAAPRFDSARWKASTGDDESKLEMVDDLLANYELIGMTLSEVDALLGESPDRSFFTEYYDYVYWLGTERSYFSIDNEWLGIKFTNGVVSEVQLLRD